VRSNWRREHAPAFVSWDALYLQHQPTKTGEQTITVVVDKLPAFAGVDPYNKRIDRNSTTSCSPAPPLASSPSITGGGAHPRAPPARGA
jgi:hypothetical protein